VIISITSPPAEWAALGDGYRVGVRIVTRSEAQALTVPVSAVFPLPPSAASAASAPGGATHGVFVLDGGRARLQPVQLAARNGSQAWVPQGLQPGARVLVYPPAGVIDGVRVAERKG
jgi:HlyD family secretion protein